MNFLERPMFAKVPRVWIRHLHKIVVAFVEIRLSQCYADRQDRVWVHPFTLAFMTIDEANIPLFMKPRYAEWHGHSKASEYEIEQ